jgi:hypothetical protein
MLTVTSGYIDGREYNNVFVGYWSREDLFLAAKNEPGGDGNNCRAWGGEQNKEDLFDGTWYLGRSVTIIGSITAPIALLFNILLIFMAFPTRWFVWLLCLHIFTAVICLLLLVGLASDVCELEDCKIGPGGVVAIVDAILWMLIAMCTSKLKRKEEDLGGGGYIQRPRGTIIAKSGEGGELYDAEALLAPLNAEPRPLAIRSKSDYRPPLHKKQPMTRSQSDCIPRSIQPTSVDDDDDDRPDGPGPPGARRLPFQQPSDKLPNGPPHLNRRDIKRPPQDLVPYESSDDELPNGRPQLTRIVGSKRRTVPLETFNSGHQPNRPPGPNRGGGKQPSHALVPFGSNDNEHPNGPQPLTRKDRKRGGSLLKKLDGEQQPNALPIPKCRRSSKQPSRAFVPLASIDDEHPNERPQLTRKDGIRRSVVPRGENSNDEPPPTGQNPRGGSKHPSQAVVPLDSSDDEHPNGRPRLTRKVSKKRLSQNSAPCERSTDTITQSTTAGPPALTRQDSRWLPEDILERKSWEEDPPAPPMRKNSKQPPVPPTRKGSKEKNGAPVRMDIKQP